MNALSDPTPSQRRRWLVVGGGMMGLTVALRLLQKGQDVVVAEAAPQFGGLTSAWRLGDVTWDRFYHVTLLSDDRLIALLKEIGLERELKWVETKTGFYSGGRLHSMSNTFEFLKFPPLNLIEKFRLGGTIFLASKLKNWRKLEQQSVERWLRRYSGRGVFEKIWLPLLRAKLGEAYRDTSAAFIWAHISRMYKARRSGIKKEMFGYVPGGYARILETMTAHLRSLGAELRVSAPVTKIEKHDRNGLVVHMGTEPQAEHFDCVISTIPSPMISQSCPQLTEEEHTRHRGVRYLGVVCASMLLKEPISPYYVTNITDTWVPLTAVIEMSTIVDRAELGGSSLVYLPKYMMSDDKGFDDSDETIRERCLSTLEKMYAHFKREHVQAFGVARARYVMALPTQRYSERLPPVVTSLPGFYALNAAHILKGNLNVNETVELADEKLNEDVWPHFFA